MFLFAKYTEGTKGHAHTGTKQYMNMPCTTTFTKKLTARTHATTFLACNKLKGAVVWASPSLRVTSYSYGYSYGLLLWASPSLRVTSYSYGTSYGPLLWASPREASTTDHPRQVTQDR